MKAKIHCGDALAELRKLPSNSVDCCVTSPPYWALRDYGVEGQIGLEATPEAWCAKLVEIFREVRRTLKPTGTCWVNVGDCYISNSHGYGETQDPKYPSGRNRSLERNTRFVQNRRAFTLKDKDLVGQPWMLAFALRADGWYLRRDIIWHKPNAMPESTRDRPTTAHEYLFLLSKSEQYFYDATAIMEPTTGTAHRRGNGVNPKAVSGWESGPGRHNVVEFSRRKVSASSRMLRDRDPSHQTPAKIRAKQKPLLLGGRRRDRGSPQCAFGLVDPDSAISRGALRHVSASLGRALHPRGIERLWLLFMVRVTVGLHRQDLRLLV
jgi:hypothetical protein